MFVILLTYKKPFVEVEKFLDAHRAYLDRHYAEGLFVCSGPQNPRTGGVILCRAQDRPTVDRLITLDPFHTHEVADYSVVEFIPTHHLSGFEKFL